MPTPPAAAWINTRSPALSPPNTDKPYSAVKNTTGTLAAVIQRPTRRNRGHYALIHYRFGGRRTQMAHHCVADRQLGHPGAHLHDHPGTLDSQLAPPRDTCPGPTSRHGN